MFEDKQVVILELLAETGDWTYGLDLVRRSKRRLGRGTVYVHLAELEDSEQVAARLEEFSECRRVPPGRRRRLYRITDAGRKRLAESPRPADGRLLIVGGLHSIAGTWARKLDECHARMTLQSWFLQPPEERTSRLEAVMELGAELLRIREIDTFSILLGEQVIESIILGNWETAAREVNDLRFEEDEGARLRYAPLWANFVALVEAHVTNLGAPQA